MSKGRFSGLELVKEYPGWFMNRTKPLRLYRSSDVSNDGVTIYRYHLGYPEEFIEPFCPLIETTPFWGEQHWKEIDGFWLWWVPVTTTGDEPLPLDRLNADLKFRRDSFAKCLDFYRRA